MLTHYCPRALEVLIGRATLHFASGYPDAKLSVRPFLAVTWLTLVPVGRELSLTASVGKAIVNNRNMAIVVVVVLFFAIFIFRFSFFFYYFCVI
jgi:hypothetical protein